MPNPISKLDNYKLQTMFYRDKVVHSTYHWDFSTRVWKTSTWRRQKRIGAGAFGEVWLERGDEGKLRAVKQLSQKSTVKADFTRELLAMAKLEDYEHLFLEFYGWYDNKDHVFLAMEYAEFGDLSQYITDSRIKKDVKEIIRQVLEGLRVLHEIGICHRDLKPQNILVISKVPVWVKIADFGISKRTKNTLLRTRCGTHGYLAPELLGALPRRKFKREPFDVVETFTHALDIWSLGCLVYEILTSHKPFFDIDIDDNEESGIYIDENLVGATVQPELDMGSLVEYCKGDIEFPTEVLESSEVDEEGIDFIKSLLTADPDNRPTAASALQNPWLIGYTSHWFENLRNEFSCLGVDLDFEGQEAILVKQLGKIGITQFLPTRKRIPSLLLGAVVKGYNSTISMLLGSPGYVLRSLDYSARGRLFQLAAEAGQLDTIKILLKHKVDVGASIGCKTLLEWAVRAEHFDAAIIFLKNVADFKTRVNCQEAFKLAVAVRNIGVQGERRQNISQRQFVGWDYNFIRLLLEHSVSSIASGNDYEEEDEEGEYQYRQTALLRAAESGHTEIVKILLGGGADLDIALLMAAKGGHIDIVKLLLDKDVDINVILYSHPCHTILVAAAGGGHIDIVDLLLDYGADINAGVSDEQGQTPLQAAAEHGYIDVCRLLLNRRADVNAEGAETKGKTALQVASMNGHIEIVRLLLDNGAHINAEPVAEFGRTALQAAAEGGHVDIVKFLLKNGADLNVTQETWREWRTIGGRSALQAAAESGQIDMVKLLLASGANINDKGVKHKGLTALQAAIRGGHIDIVRLLLDCDADINAGPAKEYGRTALQVAAEIGNVGITKLLLDNDANVNAEPGIESGRTALEAAAEGGHTLIVKLLLDNGAKINAMGGSSTALQVAASGGHIGIVRHLLICGADVNVAAKPKGSRAALQAAAEAGHINIVKLLLDNGANINTVDKRSTALQIAAHMGHIDIIELLLESGADVNSRSTSKYGRTALQAAAEMGRTEIVKLLLDNGADIEAKPAKEFGLTAYQAAEYMGHHETIKLLLANGAVENPKYLPQPAARDKSTRVTHALFRMPTILP